LTLSEPEQPTLAFILSLVGGVLILVSGAMTSMMGLYGYGGMMNGYWGYGMMSEYRWGISPMMGWFGGTFGFVGVIIGALIIISSVMLHNNPAQHSKWGALILVLSLVSIFGMAGYGVGFVLSLVGGILALTFKTHPAKT